MHLRSRDINKDILDTGWEGINGNSVYGQRRLIADTRKLLPKLPHYFNVLFGGNIVVEEEHDYDKDGKITNTGYRMTQIINRQDKNPLVAKSQAIEWTTNPTYTVEVTQSVTDTEPNVKE